MTPQEVFEKQRANRWKVAQSPARERVRKLERLRDAIQQRREKIAAAMEQDFRKNAAEVDVTELHPTLAEIKHAIDHLGDWMKPERVGTPLTLIGARSEIRSEPKGVVLILAPWNYPFFLLFAPLVGAIAAGNCVVLKPSEKTHHTAEVMKELIEATFEPDEVALFTGSHEVSDQLLALPFDHICFTGSTRIGKKVMEAAAKHLATVTLELGGKSPAIVDESADVSKSAERIAWGKFINAGQTCVAPDYVLVHESRERELIEKLRETLQRFYGADPKQSRDFARIIDDKAFARLKSLIDRSVAAGARIEAGGTADAAERYIAPTVLSGVKPGTPPMEEEIFGPILPILTFRQRSEAVNHIRAGDKPLALYVFAERDEAVEELLRGTTAGGSCVNNAVIHLGNPDLPFGGVGASGMGSYHGIHGFRAFSHQRAVLVQQMATPVKLLYPPYARKLRDLAGAAVRLLEK